MDSTIVNESEFKEFKRLFKLPEIYTIFKSKRSGFDSDPRVHDWVQQVFGYSLMDEKRYAKVKSIIPFTTYFYSFCSNIDRFEKLVKFYLLFFILDDHTECGRGKAPRNGEKIKQIWDEVILALDKISDPNKQISMSGWKPYTLYWYAILQDICLSLNPLSKRRLLKELKDYCKGSIIEAELLTDNHSYKNLADMEELLKIRRYSAATNCVIALVEYSDNISLTDEEWNDPLFQDLLMKASDAINYNNDVVSFEKEWGEQSQQMEQMCNGVAFTVLKENIPIGDALKKIAALSIQLEVETMEAMNKLLKRDPSENMKVFLDRVAHIVGGNFQVGKILDRYNKIYE